MGNPMRDGLGRFSKTYKTKGTVSRSASVGTNRKTSATGKAGVDAKRSNL